MSHHHHHHDPQRKARHLVRKIERSLRKLYKLNCQEGIEALRLVTDSLDAYAYDSANEEPDEVSNDDGNVLLDPPENLITDTAELDRIEESIDRHGVVRRNASTIRRLCASVIYYDSNGGLPSEEAERIEKSIDRHGVVPKNASTIRQLCDEVRWYLIRRNGQV